LPDGVAQRRLGDVQPDGGPAEVALFGHGDEIAQQARIQVHACPLVPSIYIFFGLFYTKKVFV
jgi:hypothetical protein